MIATRIKDRARHALTLMGIWYAVMLHITWAVLLLGQTGARHATAVAGPAHLFPNPRGLAILLVAVAACALVGIYMDKVNITKIMLLVPQQMMLGLSAYSALTAMWFAHFADGVSRPRGFIVADQIPAVFALIVHSATIVFLALQYERKVK